MIAPARVAAYDILRRIDSGRADLPAALAEVRDALPDERDRALATDIATGTFRWRAALDHLIVHYAKRPLAKLDPEVVNILRLSLYQLLHLDRVPASAVVDDGVQLTKKIGKKSASGFVNAVLRHVSRARKALPLPARPDAGASRDAQLDYLSVTLSHPRWLVARWLDRVGFERAEAWASFNNQPAPLTLRAHTGRTTREALIEELQGAHIDAQPAHWGPDAVVIARGSLRDDTPRDTYMVQDEASQVVALLAGVTPGPLVLDTCASPGGKATAIAATLASTPEARLVACDVRGRRMALLARTVAATGSTNVRLVQADVTSPLPFRARFSTVVVDAPCSGLGTLRRDPDIRWRRDEASLAQLSEAQRRMLDNAAAVVAPGGRLVYATCSSEPDENEVVTAAFLAAHPDFRAVRADAAHPGIDPALVDTRGHLRTEPDTHGLELFFGSVFERSVGL